MIPSEILIAAHLLLAASLFSVPIGLLTIARSAADLSRGELPRSVKSLGHLLGAFFVVPATFNTVRGLSLLTDYGTFGQWCFVGWAGMAVIVSIYIPLNAHKLARFIACGMEQSAD